jgi:O-antigen/teichoic acid export membrane protein
VAQQRQKTTQGAHLTSGRLLARNTVWNLVGTGAPMVIAAFSIPLLIRGLGKDRFGVLSMVWIVIGYFSLFDLGIGRALTKLVADKIGADEEHEVPPLAWTGLFLMLLLGVVGGLFTSAIAPWLVHRLLKVPSALQAETLRSFFLLGTSIPVVTATSGLRGILEAKQRFRVLNLIRIPMSTFSFAGPLLVLPFSHSLVPVVSVLLAGRTVGCLIHLSACFYAVPALRHKFTIAGSLITPLLKCSSWMMVSNMVGPAVLYVDRFLIGAALSLGAVAYYTAPFDLVNRFIVIPSAISGVLFPAFAMSIAQDPHRTGLLLNRGIKYTFLSMFPLTLMIVTLSPEVLRIWLGAAFAEHSGSVLRWLAVGILINAITVIPFSLLEGVGRPDITGKFLVLDLAIYTGIAWKLIQRFGIEGAAIAWVGRAIMELIVFLAFSYHFLPKKIFPLKLLAMGVPLAGFSLYAATLCSGLVSKGAFLCITLLSFILISWRWLLAPEERSFVTRGRAGLAVADSPVALSVATAVQFSLHGETRGTPETEAVSE